MIVKLITYNIDGLPEKLDLNDLPWLLRPIAWLYKLFKKTTIVSVNDGGNKQESIREISKMLAAERADVIAVQEDFNYHDDLFSSLPMGSHTYMGGFDLKHLFSSVKWLPYPRFKADGLCLMTNRRVRVNAIDIVPWRKSYGYFAHANDKLTRKGFRYYLLNIDGVLDVDMYILHMDADFYNIENCPDVTKDVKARKSQLQQLVEYVIDKHFDRPIIIMGDTNCSHRYQWDVEIVNKYLIEPINERSGLSIHEVVAQRNDVDRLFYVNNDLCKYKLIIESCKYGLEYEGLSDHYPLITEIKIEKR